MTYILDFDGVLFDDQRFKSDFQHVFSRHGITHGVYEQTYRQTKEAKNGSYEVKTHMRLLKQMYPYVDTQSLGRDLFALAGRSRKYIFADAKLFLRTAQKRDNKLFLLSTGDKFFQEAKVNASGITSFFTEIYITESFRKAPLFASVKKQAGRGDMVFIDDKKEVVDEIKKHHSNIKVIQMVRNAHTPRSTQVDAWIKNFSDFIFQ